MAAHARLSSPSISTVPQPMSMSTIPFAGGIMKRHEVVRTIAASHRTLHAADPSQSSLPLWKRCLCCCRLLHSEIVRLDHIIDTLETELLFQGMPIEELARA